jgi:prepilin-type N-terminal cleavage/methylation domain-containing protein/prepilin-type processing-associated H-X9-DG protein
MTAPTSTARRTRRRSHGFTLVELLVVIGIIALLISVLLPALTAARRQANKVKCMTQLREIGNALALYASENKGYWIVVQHQADDANPVNNKSLRTPTGTNRNDYWYMFLLKYFSKKGYTNAGGKRLIDFTGTPLWGCPAAEKLDADASTSSAEFNSGYGMGPYAMYTENTFVGSNSGPLPALGYPEKGGHWAMINGSGTTGNQGKYFKQSGWLRPAQKGIIGDCRAWFMETRSVADKASIVDPTPPGAIGYDSAASHQFDKWRHASKRGKKNPVSFNMLFCDGHVGEIISIEDGFRSMRLKFPL